MDEWIRLHTGEIISIEEYLIRQLPVEEQAERRQQVALAEEWAEELWLEAEGYVENAEGVYEPKEMGDGLFSEFENWEGVEPKDEERDE